MSRFEFMQRYVLAIVSGMARREAEPVPFDELARGARAMHEALAVAASDRPQPAPVLHIDAAPVEDSLTVRLRHEHAIATSALTDVHALTRCPIGANIDLREHINALVARADQLEETEKALSDLKRLAPDADALGLIRGVLQSLSTSNAGGFNAVIPHAWVEQARAWLEQANTRRAVAEQAKASDA